MISHWLWYDDIDSSEWLVLKWVDLQVSSWSLMKLGEAKITESIRWVVTNLVRVRPSSPPPLPTNSTWTWQQVRRHRLEQLSASGGCQRFPEWKGKKEIWQEKETSTKDMEGVKKAEIWRASTSHTHTHTTHTYTEKRADDGGGDVRTKKPECWESGECGWNGIGTRVRPELFFWKLRNDRWSNHNHSDVSAWMAIERRSVGVGDEYFKRMNCFTPN